MIDGKKCVVSVGTLKYLGGISGDSLPRGVVSMGGSGKEV